MKLSDCIAQVESSNNQHAIRFEDAMYRTMPVWALKSFPNIRSAHPEMSQYTAEMLACTSFGLYQILGANLWADKTIPLFTFYDYLSDEKLQYKTFSDFVAKEQFYAAEDLHGWNDERLILFAKFYNGPGNVTEYSNRMKTVAGIF